MNFTPVAPGWLSLRIIDCPAAATPVQDRLPVVIVRAVLVGDGMVHVVAEPGFFDRVQHSRRQTWVPRGDIARRWTQLKPPHLNASAMTLGVKRRSAISAASSFCWAMPAGAICTES
jgi:hypothetical protein